MSDFFVGYCTHANGCVYDNGSERCGISGSDASACNIIRLIRTKRSDELKAGMVNEKRTQDGNDA